MDDHLQVCTGCRRVVAAKRGESATGRASHLSRCARACALFATANTNPFLRQIARRPRHRHWIRTRRPLVLFARDDGTTTQTTPHLAIFR